MFDFYFDTVYYRRTSSQKVNSREISTSDPGQQRTKQHNKTKQNNMNRETTLREAEYRALIARLCKPVPPGNNSRNNSNTRPAGSRAAASPRQEAHISSQIIPGVQAGDGDKLCKEPAAALDKTQPSVAFACGTPMHGQSAHLVAEEEEELFSPGSIAGAAIATALQQRMILVPQEQIQHQLQVLESTNESALLLRREAVERECLAYEGILGIASLGRSFLVQQPLPPHHSLSTSRIAVAAVIPAPRSAFQEKQISEVRAATGATQRPQSARAARPSAIAENHRQLPASTGSMHTPPAVARTLYPKEVEATLAADEENSGEQADHLLDSFARVHQVILNELLITFNIPEESAHEAILPLSFFLDSLHCMKLSNSNSSSKNTATPSSPKGGVRNRDSSKVQLLQNLWYLRNFVDELVESSIRVLSARSLTGRSSSSSSTQAIPGIFVTLDDICVVLVCSLPHETASVGAAIDAAQVVAFTQEFVQGGIRLCAAEHAVDGGGAIENLFLLLDVHRTRLAPKQLCESVCDGIQFGGPCPTGFVSYVSFSRSLRQHAATQVEEVELLVQRFLSTRYFGSVLKKKCDASTLETRQVDVKAAASEARSFGRDLVEVLGKCATSYSGSGSEGAPHLQVLMQSLSNVSEVTLFSLTRLCTVILLLLRRRLFYEELACYTSLAGHIEDTLGIAASGGGKTFSSSSRKKAASIAIIERCWRVLTGSSFGKDLDWVITSLGLSSPEKVHLAVPWAGLDPRVVELADSVLRHPVVLPPIIAGGAAPSGPLLFSHAMRDVNGLLFSARHYFAAVVALAKLHKIGCNKLLDPHTFAKDIALVANSEEGAAATFPFLRIRTSFLSEGSVGIAAACASSTPFTKSPHAQANKTSFTWTPRFLEMLLSLPMQRHGEARSAVLNNSDKDDGSVRIPAMYPKRPQSSLSSFLRGNGQRPMMQLSDSFGRPMTRQLWTKQM